jgi:hypothetical protein
MHSVFTVYYEGPFWVGVYEQYADGGVRAAQHLFGAEPSNAELAAFAAGPEFAALAEQVERAPAVPAEERRPKKLLEATGPGTAAQRALKESLTQRVTENKAARKRRLADEADRRRRLAKEKARDRRRH